MMIFIWISKDDMPNNLIIWYKRHIHALLELQLGLTPYTIMWYAVGSLRSKMTEELCDLDYDSRILYRGDPDPRSVISNF